MVVNPTFVLAILDFPIFFLSMPALEMPVIAMLVLATFLIVRSVLETFECM